MNYIKKIMPILLLSVFLNGCSGFFDKDNTPSPAPLVNITSKVNIQPLWKTNIGSGAGNEDIKLAPAVTTAAIFTANNNGVVAANDKITGRSLWTTHTNISITAGPAANHSLVVVGGYHGEIIALNPSNGKIAWQTKTSHEILASPALTQGIAIIKTIDGKVLALSEQDGHVLWQHEQTEPTLILRGASAPKISHDSVIIGFANGNVSKYALYEGSELWQKTIAIPEGGFPVQRMVDIDADPIVLDGRIYVATYQGQISALSFLSGKSYWSSRISSYTGIAAENQTVYVSDAKSHIWAFDAENGSVLWKETRLEARNISGPALMENHIVVGDEQGYLHWLNKKNGELVGRVRVDHSAIFAAPVVDNNILYVVTKNGNLAAYTLH